MDATEAKRPMNHTSNDAASPGTAAFHRLKTRVKEVQEYLSFLVSARSDKVKTSAQKGAIAGALGMLGLLFAGGLAATFGVMIAFFFFMGIAGGLGRLFGGEIWL